MNGWAKGKPEFHTRFQIGLTIPFSVALLLRIRTNTASVANNGRMLAAIRIGSNEYLSEIRPTNNIAMIVQMPAPVPLIPLTEATEFVRYKSAGKFRMTVEKAA